MNRLKIFAILVLACPAAAAPPEGYTAKVAVSGATRMDWSFVASNQSLTRYPNGFLEADYDSTKQNYDLYVPPLKNAKQPLPALVFVSANAEPEVWKTFEPACKQFGFVFICVRNAGNPVLIPKRSRIVLDCLDDVRRKIPLDPDRTYMCGMSGGGRMACGIAFALPEYFGGILSIVASGDLRNEAYLRHRAIDRLSVALVTGQTDFNRGEVEKWRGPFWRDLGIRTKVWVQPNMGHGFPPPATITEAIRFLEEGRPKRSALAKKHPATRAAADTCLSREEDAKALFEEGKTKLGAKETTFAGLMVLKGVSERWPDLAVSREARKMLEDFEKANDRFWEADDLKEQRTTLIAEAKSLTNYVTDGIPAKSRYEAMRPDMAKQAIRFWEQIIGDSPNSDAAKEGKRRIPELQKIGGGK